MSSRDKHRVRNFRQIIYAHRCLCLCCQQFHIDPYCSTPHPWSSDLKFLFFKVKYRVFIVWHMIYGYHRLCVSSRVTYPVHIVRYIISDLPSICLCLPEFNSVLIVLHLWTSFFMFVSSREKYRAPNVRHIIHNHSRIWSCPSEIKTVSIMFEISSMLTIVYDCFFHSSIPYNIVRHIINDHPSLWLSFPELNIVSLLFDTFDISSMIIFVYACVFQSCIPCPYCLTYHLSP